MMGVLRVRAALRLSIVTGAFWGLAAVLGRIGYALIQLGGRFDAPSFFLTRFFIPGAVLGFVGGLVYAATLNIMSSESRSGRLSRRYFAAAGFIGGEVLYLIVRFALLTDVVAGPFATIVIPTIVFALLGTATGLAIHGTAARAQIGRGDKPPASLTP